MARVGCAPLFDAGTTYCHVCGGSAARVVQWEWGVGNHGKDQAVIRDCHDCKAIVTEDDILLATYESAMEELRENTMRSLSELYRLLALAA